VHRPSGCSHILKFSLDGKNSRKLLKSGRIGGGGKQGKKKINRIKIGYLRLYFFSKQPNDRSLRYGRKDGGVKQANNRTVQVHEGLLRHWKGTITFWILGSSKRKGVITSRTNDQCSSLR